MFTILFGLFGTFGLFIFGTGAGAGAGDGAGVGVGAGAVGPTGPWTTLLFLYIPNPLFPVLKIYPFFGLTLFDGIKLLFKNDGLFVFLLVNAFIFDFGLLFVDVFTLPPFKNRGFSFFFILELKLFTVFTLLTRLFTRLTLLFTRLTLLFTRLTLLFTRFTLLFKLFKLFTLFKLLLSRFTFKLLTKFTLLLNAFFSICFF